MKITLIVIGALAMAIGQGLYSAFVLSKLIDWLLIPIFGVRHYHLMEVYSIILIYTFFFRPTVKKQLQSDDFKEPLVVFFQTNLLLGIGYIVSLFL